MRRDGALTSTTNTIRNNPTKKHQHGRHEILACFKEGELCVVDVHFLVARQNTANSLHSHY
jgi:hypothetical protein